MLRSLALDAIKLYFIVYVPFFSSVLCTLGKEMGSNVVGFGYAIVANLGNHVHVQWWGVGVDKLQKFVFFRLYTKSSSRRETCLGQP